MQECSRNASTRSSDKPPAKDSCPSHGCEERAIEPEEPVLLMAPREAWSAGKSYPGQFYRRRGSQIVIGYVRGRDVQTGVAVEIVRRRLVADDQVMGRAGSSC